MSIKITGVTARDIRFPTSKNLDGSDAMNKDPDYSAAYVTLHTDQKGLQGDGMTFTIGRGNEVCVAAINSLAPLIIDHTLEEFTKDMGTFWHYITHDSQIRWIGPEKGAIHMATGAIVNAVWDLWAKVEGKPVWQLVVDMTPEELIHCLDFTYLTDVLTKEEALKMLQKQAPTKAKRKQEMLDKGYPAYTTSAGWLGYSDEKLKRLCKEAIDEGWNHIKLKVGGSLIDDKRRCGIVREVIGSDRKLMLDANQRWDVPEAIAWMQGLQEFNPWFIEEPTSPDDVLGHKKIREAIKPIGVATGEQCQNRIMFKQFLESGAIDICQIDSCRVGGVNEVITILLMAAKFNIPVCPHAGGVGLCEYVQHLSLIDFICISGSTENRVLEYVDHLHEHFVDPVTMKSGHYMPPTKPGYSITMYPASLDAFEFPNGKEWR